MARKIFISHKNTEASNVVGARILKGLEEADHVVFFDKDFLEGGMNWKKNIWDNLTSSDVVVLVLDETTAESDWVQREVDIAMALKISVLPVVIGYSVEKVQNSLQRFDLENIQAIKYKGFDEVGITTSMNEILGLIEPLSKNTIKQQKEAYDAWKRLRYPNRQAGRRTPFFVTYTHPRANNLRFHIATGDISLMKEYEILVNTENNYMQMARFYQNTVSYWVRRHGAHMDGEYLLEDTIQYELNKSANTLPVPIDTVLATSAGHEQSDIRNLTNYRYILHAAAVRFVPKANPPNQPVGIISKIIENCLVKIYEIDRTDGEIKGKHGTIIVPASENYRKIQSVLFPVFGAGEGGASLKDVADAMISSFAVVAPEVIEVRELEINDIGLSIYHEEDVELIKPIFEKHGFKEVTD